MMNTVPSILIKLSPMPKYPTVRRIMQTNNTWRVFSDKALNRNQVGRTFFGDLRTVRNIPPLLPPSVPTLLPIVNVCFDNSASISEVAQHAPRLQTLHSILRRGKIVHVEPIWVSTRSGTEVNDREINIPHSAFTPLECWLYFRGSSFS